MERVAFEKMKDEVEAERSGHVVTDTSDVPNIQVLWCDRNAWRSPASALMSLPCSTRLGTRCSSVPGVLVHVVICQSRDLTPKLDADPKTDDPKTERVDRTVW